MKTSGFLLIATFFFSGSGHAAETKIFNTAEKKKIELSDPVKAALKKWNAKFVLYTIDDYAPSVIDMFKDDKDQLPMAAAGDFDGNGEKDVALLGHDAKTEYAVIVLTKKPKFEIVVMEDSDFTGPQKNEIVGPKGREVGLGTYLQFVANDELKMAKKPSKKLEAVQVEVFGGPAHQYYVKDGKAVEFQGEE